MILIILIAYNVSYSQEIEFLSHCVSNNTQGAISVFSADIDNDGKIDIIDIMKVAASWNKAIGDQGYDLLLDLDNDGDIDIVDIMSVATFWGWTA